MKASKLKACFREVKNVWAGNLPSMWIALFYFAIVMMLSFTTGAFPPVVLFFVFVFLGGWLLSYVGKISQCISKEHTCWLDGRHVRKAWTMLAVIYIFLALFTFSRSPDIDWQWAQAIGVKPFDDWHPVVHTWTIALFQRVFRRYRLVVLVQAISFVFVMWWMFKTLIRWGINQSWALLTMMVVALSPLTIQLVGMLLKDSALGLCVLIISVMIVNIVESKGAWLDWKCVAVLASLIAYSSFVRHNGIFYTVPMMGVLLIFARKMCFCKMLCMVIVSSVFMLSYVGIRQSLKEHGYISESGRNQNFAESVGLPMSMISESYVIHPEKTPKEVCDFLEGLCDRNHWEKHYGGDYNSVKFTISNHSERIAALSPKEFFLMCLKTLERNPVSCLKSFLHVTQQAWAPCPQGLNGVGVCADGMLKADIKALQDVIIASPIGNLVAAPGCIMLVFVISFLWCVQRNYRKALVYFVPVASYHFCTMLFLTGWDWRFFFPTVIVAYPLSLLMLKE